MEYTYDPVDDDEPDYVRQANWNANFCEYSVPLSPPKRLTVKEVPSFDAAAPSLGPAVESLAKFRDAIQVRQDKERQQLREQKLKELQRAYGGSLPPQEEVERILQEDNELDTEVAFDWDEYFETKAENTTTPRTYDDIRTPRGPPQNNLYESEVKFSARQPPPRSTSFGEVPLEEVVTDSSRGSLTNRGPPTSRSRSQEQAWS